MGASGRLFFWDFLGMDRQIVFPSAIPLDTDLLNTNRFAMIALGGVIQSVFGLGTATFGLACTPTTPASLTVDVAGGGMVTLAEIDATAYGSLAADTNALMKLGYNEGITPFTLTAPTVSGQSINYLIEAAFSETDAVPIALPYYNAANPSQPFSGPSNSGTAQNTQRIQRCALQLKAGAAANTGTQVTPPVDAGWAGLYVVTVNYGQTTITSAAISVYPGAPFVAYQLPQLTPGFSNLQTSATTIWICPAGTTKVRVRAWGGGGSGGTAAGTNSGGGGGGGGEFTEAIISVTPGTSYTLTAGFAVQNSTFGVTSGSVLLTAHGGANGTNAATGAVGTGGAGGTGAPGMAFTGASGGAGVQYSGTASEGGQGGGAVQGGGGSFAPSGTGSVNGNAGNAPGGGGSGGINGGASGAGAAGFVTVEW